MNAPLSKWKLLRIKQVMAQTALAESTIYAMIARGSFPKPRKLSGMRVSVFDAAEIDEWIGEQLENEAVK